ncbi:arylsulfatase J-like [Haematobia irritans]|uniref:arylsulfatase J-like n=1 Tax=Haematobia irritans TaxID=7368 RepID=UPI003F4FEA8A
MRRKELQQIILSLSGFVVFWQIEAKLNQPNIIIILADDMGSDDVSFRGQREFLTPNIDALAYHGKILNRFYTHSMCSPSRSTLLTGMYPIHIGSQHFVLYNDEPWGLLENHLTMSTIFQAHGYSTNLIGKWHLGMGRKEFTPTYNGFDYHYGFWGGFIDYYLKRSQSNTSIGYDFHRNLDILCTPNDVYATDLFTNEAERIILENNGSKPLFLMLAHSAPHTGNLDDLMQAPPEEIEKFSYIPDIQRRIYAAMVSKLDESIGKVIESLDKAQMLENSIILFYSDNGGPTRGMFNNTASNWPLRGQKNSPWEGAARVPGVIWSPLIKNKASISEQPIYVGDLLPTFAAAANIKLEYKLDGINIWPDLKSDETNRWPQMHMEREIVHMLDDIWNLTSYMRGQYKYIQGTTSDGQYDDVLSQRNPNVIDPRDIVYGQTIKATPTSIILERYDDELLTIEKMIELRKQSGIICSRSGSSCEPLSEECLFNIWLDPCEQNNLAKDPMYANVLKKMRQKVEVFRKSAVPPRTGRILPEYAPERHNCLWTNFLNEAPIEYILQCNTKTIPCQSV